MVTTTIVAVKVLMKDRAILTLDEKDISAKARDIAPKVCDRYQRKLRRFCDMDNDAVKEPLLLTIAVLGGTGKEGKGLAYRWAKAGYKILIGSPSSERAVTAGEGRDEAQPGEPEDESAQGGPGPPALH